MEYTNEMHEEDRKIANYVYRRCFSYPQHREDLIQVATIKLWRYRHKYNAELASYCHFAYIVARQEMITFLRSQAKHTVISLNYEYGSEDDNGKEFLDFLPSHDNHALDLDYLLKTVHKVMTKRKRSDLLKNIVSSRLKLRTTTEIISELGVTRQCINDCLNEFRKQLKTQLIKEGYLTA
jgi:RNA polymerase sigma factor (sigma-70 family)